MVEIFYSRKYRRRTDSFGAEHGNGLFFQNLVDIRREDPPSSAATKVAEKRWSRGSWGSSRFPADSLAATGGGASGPCAAAAAATPPPPKPNPSSSSPSSSSPLNPNNGDSSSSRNTILSAVSGKARDVLDKVRAAAAKMAHHPTMAVKHGLPADSTVDIAGNADPKMAAPALEKPARDNIPPFLRQSLSG